MNVCVCIICAVCVYICVCTYVYAYVRAYVSVCVDVFVCVCVCIGWNKTLQMFSQMDQETQCRSCVYTTTVIIIVCVQKYYPNCYHRFCVMTFSTRGHS